MSHDCNWLRIVYTCTYNETLQRFYGSERTNARFVLKMEKRPTRVAHTQHTNTSNWNAAAKPTLEWFFHSIAVLHHNHHIFQITASVRTVACTPSATRKNVGQVRLLQSNCVRFTWLHSHPTNLFVVISGVCGPLIDSMRLQKHQILRNVVFSKINASDVNPKRFGEQILFMVLIGIFEMKSLTWSIFGGHLLGVHFDYFSRFDGWKQNNFHRFVIWCHILASLHESRDTIRSEVRIRCELANPHGKARWIKEKGETQQREEEEMNYNMRRGPNDDVSRSTQSPVARPISHLYLAHTEPYSWQLTMAVHNFAVHFSPLCKYLHSQWNTKW